MLETSDPNPHDIGLDHDELRRAIEVLERIAADRGALADVGRELRSRLFEAAGRVAHPGRTARRQLNRVKKQRQRRELDQLKAADEQLLSNTGLRKKAQQIGLLPCDDDQEALQISHAADTPHQSPSDESTPPLAPRELQLPRNCYTCKRDYRAVHEFYDSLCPDCADLNWRKRNQTFDLTGRVALVTGGRVKIGYHTALKMLRAGAHTVVTTRFPHDATTRFATEPDFNDWSDRLEIHGLDMRHVPSVESLADHLVETLPQLDFILNNACQTVRKPPGFYAHLMQEERIAFNDLPEQRRQLLSSHFHHVSGADRDPDALVAGNGHSLVSESVSRLVGSKHAADLSQLALVDGDADASEALFPTGSYDQDLQQVDLREINSWRLRLADVSTVELLEVQMVNAVAPFVLNSRLKPLMTRVSTRDKHIVNVSAMEGVFYRSFKTDKHPHTNMAKAALNMMTRTSAQDYVRDGIHMNAVDTGWITDEDPVHITERKQVEHGFHPPLDCIDAAARICDPIFSGFLTGEHQWGHFWKDYQISKW